jgi:hypothetical protein
MRIAIHQPHYLPWLAPFTSGLSPDVLFNCGPDSRRRLQGSEPNECRIAA